VQTDPLHEECRPTPIVPSREEWDKLVQRIEKIEQKSAARDEENLRGEAEPERAEAAAPVAESAAVKGRRESTPKMVMLELERPLVAAPGGAGNWFCVIKIEQPELDKFRHMTGGQPVLPVLVKPLQRCGVKRVVKPQAANGEDGYTLVLEYAAGSSESQLWPGYVKRVAQLRVASKAGSGVGLIRGKLIQGWEASVSSSHC